MVTADQRVQQRRRAGLRAAWARIREHTPTGVGHGILHEGFTGVLGDRLHEMTYANAKTEAARRSGVALDQETAGGWAGFTDKYWLAAVMPAAPDQTLRASYRFANDGGGDAGDRWQVDGVHRDGSLDVHDPRTHRRLTLPAGYVTDHVELGYATTIHGAQGITADSCHGLLTGLESRQQLYTMLSRGRRFSARLRAERPSTRVIATIVRFGF